MNKTILVLALSVVLTGCESVNSTLSSVNSVLGSINAGLSGGTATSGTSSSSIAMIDAATRSSIISALDKAVAPSDAKALFESAKPTIDRMLQRAACGASGKDMEIFAAPNVGSMTYMGALWHMNHHQSGCAHVARVNNIQKKAANAVSFTVLYQSPQSEETNKRNYTAIKQADGEWLFKWDF